MDTSAAPPRVVVGVARSPAGYAALRAAVGIARNRGLRVIAVRATSDFESSGRDYIEQAFSEAFGGVPSDLEVEAASICDGAVNAICRMAEHPTDLIVVGNGRKGRLHAAWSKTVGGSLLKDACCQVLVVPGPEMQQATRRSVRRLRHGRTDVWSKFEPEQSHSPNRPGDWR
jgi:hypothetical protein